jgi:transcriptional regulator GlxA family with amidase domain
MTSRRAHRVVVLALSGVVAFDLGIPCAIFDFVQFDGAPAYEVTVCGPDEPVRTRHFNIQIRAGLEALAIANTIIVPGVGAPLETFPAEVLDALRAAAARGARIASICSGAFVLAAAGLLDGRRATTHWLTAAELARNYPLIKVDANVLFVDEGQIVTSAGLSAGVDLCLHLVRRDFGQAAAAAVARFMVAPLDRDGGQAQFIRHEPSQSRASLAPVMDWALDRLDQPLDVIALAAQARMSTRTFLRRFREQTGTTPGKWLLHARIRFAQELLENSARPIEEIAITAGFDSPVTFRARFRRQVGVAPTTYRQRFNAPTVQRAGRRHA